MCLSFVGNNQCNPQRGKRTNYNDTSDKQLPTNYLHTVYICITYVGIFLYDIGRAKSFTKLKLTLHHDMK